MVAEGKKTLNSFGPSVSVDRTPANRDRASTPMPESRERPTARGLDVRPKGRPEEVPTEPPPARRVSRTADWLETLTSSREQKRESITERAAPPEESGVSPAEMPEPPRFDSARPAGRYSSTSGAPSTRSPSESMGYYSMRETGSERVSIPPAPRVPDFDRESTATSGRAASHSSAPRYSSAPQTIPSRAARPSMDPPDSQAPSFRAPGSRTPSSQAPRHLSSPPPPPLQAAPAPPQAASKGDTRPGLPSERPSAAPPRVYFAPHVRKQAHDWLRTGSLSLPGCPSPRHARALQRALLLAMLHEPGYQALPVGLQQRAGWLFVDGWESSAGASHPFREIDDLASVLGLPVNADSRRGLSMAVGALVPGPTSSRPPRRPSDFPEN